MAESVFPVLSGAGEPKPLVEFFGGVDVIERCVLQAEQG
jgi:hypothetical protein